jgi:hypothetical protein
MEITTTGKNEKVRLSFIIDCILVVVSYSQPKRGSTIVLPITTSCGVDREVLGIGSAC